MDSKAELKNELSAVKEQLVDMTTNKEHFEERALRAEVELEKEKLDAAKRKIEVSNLTEEVRQKERQKDHKEVTVKKLEYDIVNYKAEIKRLEEEKKSKDDEINHQKQTNAEQEEKLKQRYEENSKTDYQLKDLTA